MTKPFETPSGGEVSRNAGLVEVLNGLVQSCRVGESGFKRAAEGVKDRELRVLLITYSEQRAQFVPELEEQIRRLGLDPGESDKVAVAAHQGWLDLEAVATDEDENALITQCQNGEKAILQEYEMALRQPLPDAVRALVEKQKALIEIGYERLQSIERTAGLGGL
jgi:uncharacterized protein (TIGR02284 family)